MTKICFVSLLTATLLYASNESESLFVKSMYYIHTSQDSLACGTLEAAYKADTEAAIIAEIYGRALLRIKDSLKGFDYLKKAAKRYADGKKWDKSFNLYKAVFSYTGDYYDANSAAVSLYYKGIENLDFKTIDIATKFWIYVINHAISKQDIKAAIYLYNCKTQATNDAILKIKQPPKPLNSKVGFFEWKPVTCGSLPFLTM